jgi:hypothetical protein
VIRNVHERVVAMSPAQAWSLVERVAEPDGVLWPSDHWPPIRFDRPLTVGATGGRPGTVAAGKPTRSAQPT